jgi:hypothetical protein
MNWLVNGNFRKKRRGEFSAKYFRGSMVKKEK